MRSTLAALLLLALATGCATPRPPAWLGAEGPYAAPHDGFELTGPAGWMRRNLDGKRERFVATRDGTPLQRIVGGSTEVGKALGFGASKRVVEAGMSPAELGELVVDDLRAAEELTDVEVLETSPAPLAGRGGFHVLATFSDGGLKHRLSLYGLLEGSRFYWIFYVAPERLYFERDLGTFGEVVRSYRLRAGAPATPRS